MRSCFGGVMRFFLLRKTKGEGLFKRLCAQECEADDPGVHTHLCVYGVYGNVRNPLRER